MPDSQTVGERIQWAMRRAGVRNPQVAEALGVSEETVSRWRQDKHLPSPHHFDALARLLRVDRDWLVTGGAVPLRATGASQSAGSAKHTVPRENRWREDSLNYGAILALQRARQEIDARMDALMDQAIRGAAVGWAAEGDSLTEAGTATPASRALAAARAVHPGQHPEPEADRQTGEAG